MTSFAPIMSVRPSLSSSGNDRVHTLAPSDLTFGLHGCRRCFWSKITAGQRRPSSPMPGVFTRMDAAQREYFDGRDVRDIDPALPPGHLLCRGLKIMSEPIAVEGTASRVRFRGEMDALGVLDEGGFVAIDFKTAAHRETGVPYELQLHAYAWGLERAEWPVPVRAPVDHLGLLYFDPNRLEGEPYDLSFGIERTWKPIDRDDDWFAEFLSSMCELLDAPQPPLAHPSCGFCRWANEN
jgi:hypothetical protein